MSKMEVRVVKSMEGRVRNLASACGELGVFDVRAFMIWGFGNAWIWNTWTAISIATACFTLTKVEKREVI